MIYFRTTLLSKNTNNKLTFYFLNRSSVTLTTPTLACSYLFLGNVFDQSVIKFFLLTAGKEIVSEM